MKKHIPLFPLNLVAFPGESLNLHIFEPRYRQLTNDCFDNDIPFGIIMVKNKKPVDIGTLMEITEITTKYENGRMDIKTKGLEAFKLVEFENKMDDKLYPGGKIEYLEYDYTSDFMLLNKVLKLRYRLFKILKLKPEINVDTNHITSFDIGHKLGLSLDQELQMLAMPYENDRLQFLIDHMEKIIPSLQEIENMKHKVKMNGHFKNVIPPEIS